MAGPVGVAEALDVDAVELTLVEVEDVVVVEFDGTRLYI